MSEIEPYRLVSDERALARLQQEADAARRFARGARTENTKRAYRADWSCFTSWCEERGLSSLPAAPETVALYVASRAEGDETAPPLKVSSLSRRLSAISQAHKAAGYTSPARRSEEPLHSVWSGIVREKTLEKDKVAPALTEELKLIIRRMDEELVRVEASSDLPVWKKQKIRLANRRDRALLLIGFAGALRRSELVALQTADLNFELEGLRLRLRKSKSDQEGSGAVLGIHYGAHPETCPVRALQFWQSLARVTSGPVFRAVDRYGNLAARRLSSKTVARIVKKRVEQAGLDPAAYSGHSLRAGFCTQAARAGTQERIIMRHSRHKDVKTLREYIREGGLFQENPTDNLGL